MDRQKVATELIESLKQNGSAKPFDIVIAGVPRSGTSLAMLCMTKAAGEDAILGSKFPQERRFKIEKKEGETDKQFAVRVAIHERTITQDDLDDFQDIKDMNPHGFWECGYTVQGHIYSPEAESFEGKIVKLVSSGLHNTDPRMICKIVYMIRHPRAVAKSQERIRRMSFMRAREEADLGIHTPQMFIDQSFAAAKWFLRNPDVPKMFVKFEDLIDDPDETLSKVGEFTGLTFDEHPVEKRLQRSSKKEDEKHHDLFQYAMPIYYMMLNQDFEGVVRFYLQHSMKINKEKISSFCLRLNQRMPFNVCEICQSGDSNFIMNKMYQAESMDIEWRDEPCTFECGANPFLKDEDALTIQESIKNNHWLNL